MKKTFGKNVFVYEDFSVNRKENELHRKYKVLGAMEYAMAPPILEIEQNVDGSIGFSTTRSIQLYLFFSFIF